MSEIILPGIPVRETRTLSVQAYKAIPATAGGAPTTIFSATGPGNVDRIQLALTWAGSAPPVALVGPTVIITITVDGVPYSCPLGMFMLWYGYFTSDGASALSDEFVSKYIGVTVGQNGSFQAGYRRIYIKYNSSLTIALTDPSTYGSADPYVNIYSQVDYYPGVAPTGLFPATRNVFHMVANDWAISTIAPLGTLTILPTVTGVGELESIYYFSSATGVPMGSVGWLEMPPTIAVDGTIYQYGGTEDFFGNQFYGNQGIHARADEYGLGRFFTAGSPDNRTYWTGYRYFRESPMLFNTSIGMTWQNSSTGNNPATQVGSLATYYTVS